MRGIVVPFDAMNAELVVKDAFTMPATPNFLMQRLAFNGGLSCLR